MLLGEMIHAGVIKTPLAATEKHAAIMELVNLLVESGDLAPELREHVLEIVLQRERSMSTGMHHGIALPHGSSERINRIIGALGLSRDGIPFDSMDGLPAKVFVLLVLPRDNFQGHVRTLAGIAHLLGNAAFRNALMQAEDEKAVLRLIETEEQSGLLGKLRGAP
jgi:mannitol/fructose-specific phosphotransferase system IIA component (Ntr-type)